MVQSEQALTERIQVRFSSSEMDTIRGMAQQMNKPIGEIIRWATVSFLIITDQKLIDILKPLREIEPSVEDVHEDGTA